MVEHYGFEINPEGQSPNTVLIAKFRDMTVADLRALLKEAKDRGDLFLADEAQAEITDRSRTTVPWVEDDGGRSKYFRGLNAGDCVPRAITIAGNLNYKEVYDELAYLNKYYGRKGKKSARDGVYPDAYKRWLREHEWEWTPLMFIGSGCQVHVRPEELPERGRYVLKLSRHLVAWIDGVLYDTYDSSRDGTRCVYGYWKVPVL